AGQVVEKYPDFKNAEREKGLWISSATPDSAQKQLAKAKPGTWQLFESKGMEAERLWRDLLEDGGAWSDYRDMKMEGTVHPKHPDFKNNDTTEGLYVDSRTTPEWALTKLRELDEAEPE
ncbi:unnamed protein product, partial [Polarella glacialis]